VRALTKDRVGSKPKGLPRSDRRCGGTAWECPTSPGGLPDAQRRTGVARWGRCPGHRLMRGRDGAAGLCAPENWKAGDLVSVADSQNSSFPVPLRMWPIMSYVVARPQAAICS
jgi:hypothetical protein